MAKLLVTGATGFIGKHVIKHLLSLGHTVITTARKNAGEAVSCFPELKNTDYIQKDLNDREENYYYFFGNPDIVSAALQNKITGIINCCTGKPMSVRQFAEKFFEQRGYPIKLNLGYYPYLKHEPFAFWGDNDKLFRIVEK